MRITTGLPVVFSKVDQDFAPRRGFTVLARGSGNSLAKQSRLTARAAIAARTGAAGIRVRHFGPREISQGFAGNPPTLCPPERRLIIGRSAPLAHSEGVPLASA